MSIWCQIAPTVPVLPVVPANNYCAVNNLGNDASMAWKRSSVRSRSGPPISLKYFKILILRQESPEFPRKISASCS